MEGRTVARKQYYSNYSSYGRRKRVKPRAYIIFTLVSFLLVVGSFVFNIFHQVNSLSVATVEPSALNFEPIPTVDTWHNKEVKFVYLTFDDGPSKNANKILDILDSHGIKGTFFVLGDSIETYSGAKEVLKRMADTGHYIGMHSMTHNYDHLYNGPNAAQNFTNEMLELQALIKEVTGGYVSELCRAPYGTGGGTFTDAHVEELKKAGIKCWDWDVDSLDWESGATVDKIMENIKYCMNLWNYPTHTVVLFHEKDATVEVLPKVIEYYQDLGYEFLPYNPDSHIVKNLFGSKDI